MYYLDNGFVIRDRIFTNNSWSDGQLGAMDIKAAPGAGLAAVLLPNASGVRINVFYQAIDPREYRLS